MKVMQNDFCSVKTVSPLQILQSNTVVLKHEPKLTAAVSESLQ